jgi:hypothetical protein
MTVLNKFQGTRILWDIEKPTETKTSTQIMSFSSKNDQIDSILPLMTKRHENENAHVGSSSFVLRTQTFFKCKMNKKKLLSKVFMVLVTFLFFLNSHFLIFLQIKESFNISEIKINEDTYHNDSSSSVSIETKSNFSNEKIYDHFECAPELGTWYSKFMDNAWFWVDIFIYFFIPFFTMCITFSIIKFKLKTINRNYASMLLEREYVNYNKRIYLKNIKRNNKIIYVLFGINLYFCLSIVPFSIFTLFKNITANLSLEESFYLKSFVEVLFYSNNALSIVFYGFTSKDFRKTLKQMLLLDKTIYKKRNSMTESRIEKLTVFLNKNV